MRNHVAEVVEGLPSAQTIKVHGQMCSELLKLVVRISKVLPEIEAARPRCSSGIEALCLLNIGIVKAKFVLQSCSQSSVLYLVLTGDAIVSRCKKSRNILAQSLGIIQTMVPVMLAAKIYGIIADLRSAAFYLDPAEEEAGRMLRELLHRYVSTVNSTEEAALADIRTVSSHLRISSQKAVLIEKRSIRRLLDKFGECEPSKGNNRSKRKILLFFLNLLNKYGKIIAKEQKDNGSSYRGDPFPSSSPYHLSNEVEPRADCRSNEAQIDILSRPVPPEEFLCSLSSRLMYDPVVIASGQTYERMWIEKWFDEGHDTCPKTNVKLANLSFTSNMGLKELIRKWCAKHGVSIPDPKIQEALVKPWESSANSISSLSSSMVDLNLQLDFSNVSLGASEVSDPSCTKISNDVKASHEIDMVFLSGFSTLPWDSRCNAVEDMKRLLKHNDESLSVPSGEFIRVIFRFLKDAHDLRDIEARMTGCLLLFEFVQKHRNSVSCMKEDDYTLLASFLDTEVSKQALSIIEVLSFHQQCGFKIAESGALIGILNILDGQIQELLEPALKILSNLSSNGDSSFINPCEFIPKLIPLFDDNSLARYCITILKNLCDKEEARISVAKTDGCLACIAKLLEKDDHEDQEHAVSILVSLCSQRVEFCQLVMDEGVIPGLVHVSVNGNNQAKAMAMELLRILRDEFNTSGEKSESDVRIDSVGPRNDKNRRKAAGLFGKIFWKPSGKKRN